MNDNTETTSATHGENGATDDRRPRIPPRIAMVLYGSLPHDVRVRKEAVTLQEAGGRIRVYDTEWLLPASRAPSGIERISPVAVPPHRRNSPVQLLKFWLAATRALLVDRRRVDVVHAHDLTGLPPAVVLKSLVPHIRLVYDAHEMFPEAARDKVSPRAYPFFLGLEILCGRFADALITVSPTMLELLKRRVPAPAQLVMNVPDLVGIRSACGRIPACEPPERRARVKVAYSGGVLPQRGYRQLVEAAALLERRHPGRYTFMIIGDGPLLPSVRRLVRERGLADNFHFTGRVDFLKNLSLIAVCDIAVALYEDTWNNNVGLSNKLFEYMMLGMPVVFTKLAQSLPILKGIGAIIVEQPVCPERVAEAIARLADDVELRRRMSSAGRRLVSRWFNWERESRKLLRVYETLPED